MTWDPQRHPRTHLGKGRGQFEKRVAGAPIGSLRNSLSRADVIAGIREVIDDVRAHGDAARFQIIGGAALVLTVNGDRRPTQDVDAVLTPAHAIEEAAGRVAARHGWGLDWLNSDAEQFLPSGFGRPAEWTTIYEDEGACIQAATPETLLAMKLSSAQRRGNREYDDLADLFKLVGIESVDEAERVPTQFYPGDELTPKTARLVEAVLSDDRPAPTPPDPPAFRG